MDYKTYHYGDNDLNDCGWGCSYRNIQTVISCIKKNYNPNIIIPSLPDILSYFNKNINCNNLTDLWIEPYHIGLYLYYFNKKIKGENYLYVIKDNDISKILKTEINIYLENNLIINDFDNLYLLIKRHFEKSKLPIIIDNGTYSYCIVLQNENVLLIDPHIVSNNNVKKITMDYIKNSFWMLYIPSYKLS